MLTPKLSEVIFFFLVLSATPGPAEPRGPRGPMGPRGTRGPLASPILGPDEGKIFFLKCSTMYFFFIRKSGIHPLSHKVSFIALIFLAIDVGKQ